MGCPGVRGNRAILHCRALTVRPHSCDQCQCISPLHFNCVGFWCLPGGWERRNYVFFLICCILCVLYCCCVVWYRVSMFDLQWLSHATRHGQRIIPSSCLFVVFVWFVVCLFMFVCLRVCVSVCFFEWLCVCSCVFVFCLFVCWFVCLSVGGCGCLLFGVAMGKACDLHSGCPGCGFVAGRILDATGEQFHAFDPGLICRRSGKGGQPFGDAVCSMHNSCQHSNGQWFDDAVCSIHASILFCCRRSVGQWFDAAVFSSCTTGPPCRSPAGPWFGDRRVPMLWGQGVMQCFRF